MIFSKRAAAAPRHRQDRPGRAQGPVRALNALADRPPNAADRRRRRRRPGRRASRCGRDGSTAILRLASGEQAFGHFSRSARDGRVTVAVPQVETGQGIWTALPQIVADELGAEWETVAVEPAPLTRPTRTRWPRRKAGSTASAMRRGDCGDGRCGSPPGRPRSARSSSRCARPAAIARAMLIGAAADRWNVDPSECDTADGFVLHGGKTFTFGELAEEAAGRSPPSNPPLRQRPEVAADRPAAAAPRPARQERRQLPLRRRCAPARHAVRLGPPRAARRPADRLFSRCLRRCRAFATSSSRETVAGGGRRQLVGGRAGAQGRQSHVQRHPDAGSPPAACSTTALDSGDAQQWFAAATMIRRSRGSRAARRDLLCRAGPASRARAADRDRSLHRRPARSLGADPGARFARAAAEAASRRPVTLYPMPVGEPGGRALEADAIPIAVELARELKRPVQLSLSPIVEPEPRPASRRARWRG